MKKIGWIYLLLGLFLLGSSLTAAQASILRSDFTWTVDFADPANSLGVMIGDLITGFAIYGSSLTDDGIIASNEFGRFPGASLEVTVGNQTFNASGDIEIGLPEDTFPVLFLGTNGVVDSITEILIPGFSTEPEFSDFTIISNALTADFGRITAGNFTSQLQIPVASTLALMLIGLALTRTSRRR